MARIESGASRRIVEKTHAALRVILATAVEWGRIAANPAERVRLPAHESHVEQPVERVLTLEQLRHLADVGAVNRAHATLIRVAGEAGLRRGELIGLRWTDLDLPARRITVRRSVWQERGGARRGTKTEKPTKGRRRRAVAISEDLARALADHYAEAVVERGVAANGKCGPAATAGRWARTRLPRSSSAPRTDAAWSRTRSRGRRVSGHVAW